MLLIEKALFQLHMPQVANIFAAQVGTPVQMGVGKHVTFIMQLGTGGVGTGTITVQAAPLVNMAGATAIPFTYRVQATAQTTDAFAAPSTVATSAGFTTAAGAQQLVFIEVEARALGAGNQFVQVVTAQGAAGAVVGSCVAVVSEPFFVGQTPPTTFS